MLSLSLKSILDNRLRYLPEVTGRAISSIDWPTKVIDIGRKYGLHIDDIEELQGVVLKSMTGLLPPSDFETNLIGATAVSPTTAEQMITDMNAQIFEPIHTFVMNNGKQPDALTASGIVVEQEPVIPNPPYKPLPASQSLGDPLLQGEGSDLEIVSSSPEPKAKPQVKGNFNDFFVLK